MRTTAGIERVFAAAIFAVAITACSGGPPTTAPPTSQASHVLTEVNFSIKLPAKPGIHPAYISPGTKSAVVAVSGATTVPSTTIPCSTGTCSGQVQAPVGTDTFTVTLYDGANGTGNILSQGTIGQTIVANQTNNVMVAFGGVITSIVITLVPNGVTPGTPATIAVNVQGRDADGYAIIGGNPYTTSITLQDSDASGSTTLSPTTVTSPQTNVTLAYNGSSSFKSATISASAAGVPNGNVTPDTLTLKTAGLGGPPLGPNNASWGPPAVAGALNFPVQSGYDGSGQTVAIIMDASPSASDLVAYFSYFQIPQTSRTITFESVDGGPNGSDPSGPGEVTLDTETVASLAPGANVVVYGIPDLARQHVNDAFNQVVSDGLAHVVSYSAGGCESAVEVSTTAPILQVAANNGISVVAASGDQGNECFTGGIPQYQPGVNYPASDANVIGVGGTETLPPNYLTSTTAWNDFACASGQCATGGGVSQFVALPAYQQGVPGEASTQYRNVPDVAMPAEDAAVYLNGTWTAFYGTSWSAPEFAALQAEVDQYCNLRYSEPASIPYVIYASKPSAFIDVTSGNNQFAGTTPFFSAGLGYDNVSGLGVPAGMTYANTICPNRVPLARRRGPVAALRQSSQSARVRVLDVRPLARGLTDLGTRSSSALTRIQLVLQPTSEAAIDEEKVVSDLQSHGFQIVKTYGNHLVVDAQAPASVVSSYFATTIHNVVQPRYGMRYAPESPATIPAAIAPYVSGIILDNVVTMRPL